MTRTIPLARYLFERLRQCGVKHVYGVPGDYTLKALDHLQASGSKWIGCCNELNAGFAADGYARARGLGALLTTFGVGELSAINAVAGSYAEHVPVVHIVCLPQRHLIESGAIVHHVLEARRSRVFAKLHQRVTSAQAYLEDENNAPDQIDEALCKAMYESRPAYIELPCDMVAKEVPAARLEQELPAEQEPTAVLLKTTNNFLGRLTRLLQKSKQPLLLIDRGMGMDSLRPEINTFVSQSGIPTLTMPSGASMIYHDIPNYFGVHAGPVGQINTMPYLDSADLVFAFGPMFSDTQTLGWHVVPPSEKTVIIHRNHATFSSDNKAGKEQISCDARILLKGLTDHVARTSLSKPNTKSLGNFRKVMASRGGDGEEAIDQTSFYIRLNPYLRPNDTILLGNATPILGGRDFVLPDPSTRVIASGQWFSIGSMLPAALGVGLAKRASNIDGRVVLLEGDGSFQVTAQELSTIIRHRLNITIFIINNAGYAYERLIHDVEASYHDIASWSYLSLPRAFGANRALERANARNEEYSVDTAIMRTWNDLDSFLQTEKFDNGAGGKGKKGLKLIDVSFARTDVPDKFRRVFEAAGKSLG